MGVFKGIKLSTLPLPRASNFRSREVCEGAELEAHCARIDVVVVVSKNHVVVPCIRLLSISFNTLRAWDVV